MTTTNSFGRIPRSHTGHGGRQSLRHIQKYESFRPSWLPMRLTFFFKVIKLCGPEPLTKYFVLAVVALQVTCAVCLCNTPVISLRYILTAYLIGATANQNLFLAIHEISHNLAFKAPLANRLFAVFANLPIGVPYSAAFRVSNSVANVKSLDCKANRTTALSSDPPQVFRSRWPRHRPSYISRGLLPRLPFGQSLFLHLPNPVLCTPSNDGLPITIDPNPSLQHHRSIILRLPSLAVCWRPSLDISNYELLSCRLVASLCRSLHR